MKSKFYHGISKILTYGTALSILFITLAVIETFIFSTEITTYKNVELIKIIDGLFLFNPTDTLYMALLVIILTPVVNLFYILLYSFMQKHYYTAGFSFIILIILTTAIMIGIK